MTCSGLRAEEAWHYAPEPCQNQRAFYLGGSHHKRPNSAAVSRRMLMDQLGHVLNLNVALRD